MRGGGRDDGVGLAELAVDFFEAFQESGQCRGADRDVPSHRDIAVAQCAGDDLDLFFCSRVLDPEQIVGQRLAEAAVDVRDCVGSDAAAFEASGVDPALDVDMRFGFQLEVALFGVLAVVALEGALDVDRVGVVAFNQVAVVAVHRAHEIGERGQQAFRQGAPEAGALLRQL